MNEFDKKYMEEWKAYEKQYADFNKVFKNGSSESRVASIKSDFLTKFNAVGGHLLKTSKKIQVLDRRYGGIYVGGQHGISNQSYSSSGGIEMKDVVLLFTQLSKVDEKLKSELSSRLYDKWLSFLLVFDGGVEKILFGQNKIADAGEVEIKEMVLINKSKLKQLNNFDEDSDDDADDDDEDDDDYEFQEAYLKKISFVPDEEGALSCNLVFRGGTISLSDFDKKDLFFLRSHFGKILDAEASFREKEKGVVEEIKEQFAKFEERAVPFLSLKEL